MTNPDPPVTVAQFARELVRILLNKAADAERTAYKTANSDHAELLFREALVWRESENYVEILASRHGVKMEEVT